MLSSSDFRCLLFSDFLRIVLSGFLGVVARVLGARQPPGTDISLVLDLRIRVLILKGNMSANSTKY